MHYIQDLKEKETEEKLDRQYKSSLTWHHLDWH